MQRERSKGGLERGAVNGDGPARRAQTSSGRHISPKRPRHHHRQSCLVTPFPRTRSKQNPFRSTRLILCRARW